MQASLVFLGGRLDCREEALSTVSGGTLDLGPRLSSRSSFPEGGKGSNWAKGATGVESEQRLTVPGQQCSWNVLSMRSTQRVREKVDPAGPYVEATCCDLTSANMVLLNC